jgi:hypothetical protein
MTKARIRRIPNDIIGQRECHGVQGLQRPAKALKWLTLTNPRLQVWCDDIAPMTKMTESDNRRKTGQRVWRLRKLHQWVDAELQVDGPIVELQLFLNGELTYERRWPSREAALAEAAGKRAELEREGWMAHW